MDRILIVEDTQLNIEMLKAALEDNYKISVAKNGQMGLNIIQKVVPDLILLDVMMPVMDGYEFIQEIKRIDAYKEIPVIFLTAQMELHEKTKAFELGAVDYITKPFDVLEVKSRVATHLALSNSKKEISELLTKTIGGTMKMLMEILSTSNPIAYAISSKMKRTSKQLAMKARVNEMWKIEIASMLSLIGTYNIPSEVLLDLMRGSPVDQEYEKLFANHPSVGARLIEQIPRLGDVADIVGLQNESMGYLDLDPENVIQSGAQILKVASFYEMNLLCGKSSEMILQEMAGDRQLFHPKLVEALQSDIQSATIENVDYVGVLVLENGMVLNEDVYNSDGKRIINKGTVVNELVKEHLQLLYELGLVQSRIKVLL